MSDDTKMSLQEATNIGHQLLVMGRLSLSQLEQAQNKDKEYRAKGVTVRFGHICKELGFVTDVDLEAAECAQRQARDTRATNESEISEAIQIARQVVGVNERTTTSRLRALEAMDAVASQSSGHK